MQSSKAVISGAVSAPTSALTTAGIESKRASWQAHLLQFLSSAIPVGGSLPREVWLQRHRFLVVLTWLHAIVIALLGPVLGYRWVFSFGALTTDGTIPHVLLEASVVALFAILARWRRIEPTLQAVCVALGLVTSSAVFVHLSGGYIELH